MAVWSFGSDLCRLQCFRSCEISILLTAVSPAPVSKSDRLILTVVGAIANETWKRKVGLLYIAIFDVSVASGRSS